MFLFGSIGLTYIVFQVLKDIPRRSFYITTKIGRYGATWPTKFDFSAARAHQSINGSLERLGLEYVDIIQVQDLEFALDLNQILNETLPAVQEMVKQGKARYCARS